MNNADEIVRLTEKRNGENVIPLRNAVCGVGLPRWTLSNNGLNETYLSGVAADRLAAYEDTGLTPGDVKDLQALCKENGLAEYVDLIVEAKRQMARDNENSMERDERIENLQAENANLWEGITEMQAEIRKLDQQVASLQADLARVTADRDAAEAERDALMRRHSKQVETIRRRIDAGGITEEESRLLDDLMFETRYDRRGVQAGEGETE